MRSGLGSTRVVIGRRDRGSGTVLVVAGIAVLLSLTVGGLFVAGAVVAAHRAQAAADLTALAAGSVLMTGDSPAQACLAGGRLASHNGASLTGCSPDGGLGVEVVVQVRAPFGLGVATARAKAGPAVVR